MSISKQTICLLPSADFISGVSLTHFQPLLHIMLKSLWIEYRPYRRKFYGSSNRHDGEPGTMNINTIRQQFEFSRNFLFRIAKPSWVTNEYFFWLFNFVVVVVLRWTIEYWYIKFVYCSRSLRNMIVRLFSGLAQIIRISVGWLVVNELQSFRLFIPFPIVAL